MDDAQQEITDKLDKELHRYIGQYASLFLLAEEIDVMRQDPALQASEIKSHIVTAWLKRLHEIIQEGLQAPNTPK